MRIVVINFSGNVGKSTVARHVCAPRLGNPPVISLESINDDGTATPEEWTYRAEQYRQVQEALLVVPDLILDVGSSNVEEFVEQLRRARSSQDDFDLVIVPTVPARKQQRDTIATLHALLELGVDPVRLRLLFNLVGRHDEIEQVFAPLYTYWETTNRAFPWNPEARLLEHDFCRELSTDRTLESILADERDLRALIREASDLGEKQRLASALIDRRQAKPLQEEMDRAFAALMQGVSTDDR